MLGKSRAGPAGSAVRSTVRARQELRCHETGGENALDDASGEVGEEWEEPQCQWEGEREMGEEMMGILR